MLLFLVSIGHWLEIRAQKTSKEAVETLWENIPQEANWITSSGESATPIDDLPQEVSSALLSAKLNGIRKSSGGCRVRGCGGVIRRMVFKQVARELHSTMKMWCTDKQFGLQKDGCGRMFRYLQTLYHGRQGLVVLSADQRDAYSHVNPP